MPRQRNRNSEEIMYQRRMQDQKMMADMLKMINASTPQTMLGYGLGKLLRGAWDHYWDRKAENTKIGENGKTISPRKIAPQTINGVDVSNWVVDESKPSYTGIEPTKGLLGTNLGVGQKQTTQEQPNGQTTTTTETYAFNPNDYAIAAPERMALNEMAAQRMIGDNDPFGLYSKKNPLGDINLRY